MFTGKVMLIPDYIDEIDKLKQENQSLKKQLDVLKHNEKQASDSCRQHRLASKNHIRRLKRREEQIMRLKNQQKEFIEYLAKQSELYKKDMENINYIKEPFKWEEYNDIAHEYKVILSKYKEIIGVSDENNT